MNRRAFFFTFIAFAILSIFIIVFTSTQVSQKSALRSDRSRVDVLNTFTKDLMYVYLPRVLLTSSRTALNCMITDIEGSHVPIDDVDLRMQELLTSGTLRGVAQPAMVNQTLSEWTARIDQLGQKSFRINSTVQFSNIDVSQTDPWTIVVSAQVNVLTNLSDTIYSTGDTLYANISLTGWRDPLFALYGSSRRISRSPTNLWNEQLFMIHVWNATYDHFPYSPSFLMRLENRTEASACCGIESVLDDAYGDLNRSYVDYLFFNNTYSCNNSFPFNSVLNLTTVQQEWHGSTRYMKMDSQHATYFNVSEGYRPDACS
jgi:hypothetical protein